MNSFRIKLCFRSKIEVKPESKSAPLFKQEKPKADDSDEDGDDDVADIPVVAQAKQKSGNRRVSVSAESMDPAKLKSQMSQVSILFQLF